MSHKPMLDVYEIPKPGQWVTLSLQHLFASGVVLNLILPGKPTLSEDMFESEAEEEQLKMKIG